MPGKPSHPLQIGAKLLHARNSKAAERVSSGFFYICAPAVLPAFSIRKERQMYRSVRTLIFAGISSLFLFFAAPLLSGAAMATDFLLVPVWSVEGSIALDRLGHALLIDGADTSQVRTIAFVDRASTHDRYSAGGFTLTDDGAHC